MVMQASAAARSSVSKGETVAQRTSNRAACPPAVGQIFRPCVDLEASSSPSLGESAVLSAELVA